MLKVRNKRIYQLGECLIFPQHMRSVAPTVLLAVALVTPILVFYLEGEINEDRHVADESPFPRLCWPCGLCGEVLDYDLRAMERKQVLDLGSLQRLGWIC